MRERWIALPGDNGTSSRTTFDDQGTKHVTLVVRDSCTHSHRHRQLMGAVKSPGASKLPKQLGISSLSSPALANLETDSSQMVPSMYCVYICCAATYNRQKGSQIQLGKPKIVGQEFYFLVSFSNYQNSRRHYKNILDILNFCFLS